MKKLRDIFWFLFRFDPIHAEKYRKVSKNGFYHWEAYQDGVWQRLYEHSPSGGRYVYEFNGCWPLNSNNRYKTDEELIDKFIKIREIALNPNHDAHKITYTEYK